MTYTEFKQLSEAQQVAILVPIFEAANALQRAEVDTQR
jgi:hypothetical protein